MVEDPKVAPTEGQWERFGFWTDLDDERAIVGDWWADVDGHENAGLVSVYPTANAVAESTASLPELQPTHS